MVVGAGLLNRTLQDVANRADGDGIIKQVTKEFTDSADGTVTDQGQPQDCLIDPLFCDGKVEENLRRIVLVGDEGILEGILRRVHLSSDELTANCVLCG